MALPWLLIGNRGCLFLRSPMALTSGGLVAMFDPSYSDMILLLIPGLKSIPNTLGEEGSVQFVENLTTCIDIISEHLPLLLGSELVNLAVFVQLSADPVLQQVHRPKILTEVEPCQIQVVTVLFIRVALLHQYAIFVNVAVSKSLAGQHGDRSGHSHHNSDQQIL